MGLFDSTCCPPKPKRTMDYILNWIDTNGLVISKNTRSITDLTEWRNSIEEDLYTHVKDVADEYITAYDWSQVPQFDTLSRKIDAKANKVENAITGHIVSLDNIGDLVDSGKKSSDFAEADHEHNYISDFSGYDNSGASVSVGEGDQGVGVISMLVKGDGHGTDSKEAKIDYYNIDNLIRALEDPDTTPVSGSDKLITSGGVYGELSKKVNKLKEITISDDDGSYPGVFEIPPSKESEFSSALVEGAANARPVIVNIYVHINNTPHWFKSIGYIYVESTEVNTETYDLKAYICVNGYVFMRTGQELMRETTWDQGLTKLSSDILSSNNSN